MSCAIHRKPPPGAEDTKPRTMTTTRASSAATGGSEGSIRRIRLTDRDSSRVTLLADPPVLDESAGVGKHLVEWLLDKALPIRITLDDAPLTEADIKKESGEADRLVVLSACDEGRPPGSLSHRPDDERVKDIDKGKTAVVSLRAHPPSTPDEELSDAAASELARAIGLEMVPE